MASSGGIPVASPNPLPVVVGAASAANILDGFLSFSATTGATTLLTIPQGRTWVGTITCALSCAEGAAGVATAQAAVTVATAGAGVTPAAGTVMMGQAIAAANAAGGTVGTSASEAFSFPLAVVAPAGNAVTVTVASTNSGSFSNAFVSASGQLL